MLFLMLVEFMIRVEIDMIIIRRVLLRFLDMGLLLNLVVLVLFIRYTFTFLFFNTKF